MVVGNALRRRNIRAVLTGGACASLYSGGTYTSADADFELIAETELVHLDETMRSVGFRREGDRYVHPDSEYFVEFLPGPLAIGLDDGIRPATRKFDGGAVLLLSPSDSCRDRLAAYYHWNDRQSLAVAVQIAIRNRIRWSVLSRWSEEEGFGGEIRRVRSAGCEGQARLTSQDPRPTAAADAPLPATHPVDRAHWKLYASPTDGPPDLTEPKGNESNALAWPQETDPNA
jgi:hypothetical protein